MVTISDIEDFRTQFEMFAVNSLLPAVCTNNSVGNKWIETNLCVYFVVYREFFFHAYDIFPSLCKQGSVLYNYIKTGELKRSDGSSITEGNRIHSFLVGEININPVFRELLRFVWRGQFFRKTLSLWQTSHPLTRRMNRNNNTPTFRTGKLMQWDETSIKTCYSIRMRRFFTGT